MKYLIIGMTLCAGLYGILEVEIRAMERIQQQEKEEACNKPTPFSETYCNHK